MSLSDPERWLPVVGWEGWYEASDHGQVRSVDRYVSHGTGTERRRLRGRVLSLITDDSGHLYVELSLNGVVTQRRVHTLVLEAFVGPCPDGMEGCHWDDDPAHNHLSNLRWDTRSENHRDLVRNGRHYQANKTACPLEHLLISPNLVPSLLPKRSCLVCNRAHSSASYARSKGRPYDFRAAAHRNYRKITGLVSR